MKQGSLGAGTQQHTAAHSSKYTQRTMPAQSVPNDATPQLTTYPVHATRQPGGINYTLGAAITHYQQERCTPWIDDRTKIKAKTH